MNEGIARGEYAFALASVWLGLNLVPAEMIGYTRYTPWWSAVMAVFSIKAIAESRIAKPIRRAAAVLVAGAVSFTCFWYYALYPVRLARSIDTHRAFHEFLAANPAPEVFCALTGHAFKYERASLANAVLQVRQLPELAGAKIVFPSGVNKQEGDDNPPDLSGFAQIPDFPLFVRAELHPDSFRHPASLHYSGTTPGYLAKTYFVTAPRLVWLHLKRALQAR